MARPGRPQEGEMDNKIKITLPAANVKIQNYHLYVGTPRFEIPPDTRRLYERAVYWLLIAMHARAERFLHWCYRASRRYAPPQPQRVGMNYREIAIPASELTANAPNV